MDECVLLGWCLGIFKHELGEIKDTVPHLELLTHEEGRGILLLFKIALSDLSSGVGQLYFDAIHYEFHRLDMDVARLNLFNFIQVFISAHHLHCPVVQTALLLVLRLLIQTLCFSCPGVFCASWLL